jgi:hypothetical protein
LKKEGISTEYVSEYAKELVWEGNQALLDGSLSSQTHIFEEQNRRLARLQGKVSVVVTDSPIILGLIYCKQLNAETEVRMLETFRGYNNFNLFIRRGAGFEEAGRIHTLQQSQEIDNEIHAMLKKHGIYYGTYYRDRTHTILSNIKHSLYNPRLFADPPAQPALTQEGLTR